MSLDLPVLISAMKMNTKTQNLNKTQQKCTWIDVEGRRCRGGVMGMGGSTDSHLWLAPAPSSEERVMRNMILAWKQSFLLAACFTPANDSMDYLCMMWPFPVMVALSEDSIARKRGYSLVIWEVPHTNTTPESRAWAWFWWAHWRLLMYSVSECSSPDLDLKKKKKDRNFP